PFREPRLHPSAPVAGGQSHRFGGSLHLRRHPPEPRRHVASVHPRSAGNPAPDAGASDLLARTGRGTTRVRSLARRRTREVVVGMTPRRLLLHGGFVYTASPERPCLDQGWVLVIGDTNAALGVPDEPEPDHDERWSAHGKLVLPGFVNPHWHESFVAP